MMNPIQFSGDLLAREQITRTNVQRVRTDLQLDWIDLYLRKCSVSCGYYSVYPLYKLVCKQLYTYNVACNTCINKQACKIIIYRLVTDNIIHPPDYKTYQHYQLAI